MTRIKWPLPPGVRSPDISKSDFLSAPGKKVEIVLYKENLLPAVIAIYERRVFDMIL